MRSDDCEALLLDEQIWEQEIAGLRARLADSERECARLRAENELLRQAPTPY